MQSLIILSAVGAGIWKTGREMFQELFTEYMYFEDVIQCSINFSEIRHCYHLGKVCLSLIPNSLYSSTVSFIKLKSYGTWIAPINIVIYSGFRSILL